MAAEATCGSGAASTKCVAEAAQKSNITSFQRRGPKAGGTESSGPRLVSIAGTRPSLRNGQLLVSTGLPALDQLLGRFRTDVGSPEGKLREGACRESHLDPRPQVFPLRDVERRALA
uniref:Elongator complex protein 4 n=1 Tax=Urocitellus parryii TaxID=9999 RepID=A0A8D2IGA1_UROPR